MMNIAAPIKPVNDKKGQEPKKETESDSPNIIIEPDSPFDKARSSIDVVNQVENMKYNKSDSFNPNPTIN